MEYLLNDQKLSIAGEKKCEVCWKLLFIYLFFSTFWLLPTLASFWMTKGIFPEKFRQK